MSGLPSTAVPSWWHLGSPPQQGATTLRGPLKPCLGWGGGSDGPHHAGPLRTRGPGRACGWGPPSVPLLSCSPGLERLESLKYTKLGGPKSWKLRKPPVLRAPPSGGLCGADPINICNSPPCALCSLNYCPAASPRARNLWSWWGWPLLSLGSAGHKVVAFDSAYSKEGLCGWYSGLLPTLFYFCFED